MDGADDAPQRGRAPSAGSRRSVHISRIVGVTPVRQLALNEHSSLVGRIEERPRGYPRVQSHVVEPPSLRDAELTGVDVAVLGRIAGEWKDAAVHIAAKEERSPFSSNRRPSTASSRSPKRRGPYPRQRLSPTGPRGGRGTIAVRPEVSAGPEREVENGQPCRPEAATPPTASATGESRQARALARARDRRRKCPAHARHNGRSAPRRAGSPHARPRQARADQSGRADDAAHVVAV